MSTNNGEQDVDWEDIYSKLDELAATRAQEKQQEDERRREWFRNWTEVIEEVVRKEKNNGGKE